MGLKAHHYKPFVITIVISVLISFGSEAAAEAFRSVPRVARNPAFSVPAILRPRVDFWIDVFTRYGKRHIVFHHRSFPQATFMVVDMSKDVQGMSDVQIDRYKKKIIKKYTAEIKKALGHLAQGKAPVTRLQQTVQKEMAFLPSGVGKYKQAVSEGLVRTQTGIKEKYAEAIVRSGRYLHVIEQIFVKDHGLPVELTRLPFIESSFDYKAYSSVGAAGIWQFMRRTAKSYMKVNNLVDERRDVVSSTRGAAKYLGYAYEKLSSWPLALTSYNHGIAGVSRRVKKAGTRDLSRIIEHPTERYMGFASTNFYPEFLAALEVYDNVSRYFPGLKIESPRHFAQYKLPNSVSVKYVQSKLGIDTEALKELNYAVSSRVWSGYYRLPYGYVLKVPPEYGPKLARLKTPETGASRIAPGTSSVHGGTVYKVRRGDTLSKIARRYRTSVSRLRSINGLHSDLVRVGELLVVKQRTASVRSATEQGGVKYYKVRSGDTLSGIAKSFGTSINALRQQNGLKSSRIQVGQSLKVGQVVKDRAPSQTVSSVPRTVDTAYYTVRRGDTLYSIGRRFGISVATVKRMNSLSSSRIKIGQKLKVQVAAGSATSASSTYKVRSGDSLWSISKKLRVSIPSLKRANNLRGNTLHVGQVLRVP